MPRLVARRWSPTELDRLLPRADRGPFGYEAFVPDRLVDLRWTLPLDLAEALSTTERRVRELNHSSRHLASLEALSRLLLRSESISSSRIEGLQVGNRRLAEALFDPEHSGGVERSVAANVLALTRAIEFGATAAALTVGDVLEIHHVLIHGDEPGIAGRLRTEQNWIGGATPRTAEFIPPPEDEVPPLLEDLVAYCNRDDIPPLVQAAIAHAQFETIHPFADGNGRVGRCLIHALLRRRGVVEHYVPPISVVLATNGRAYVEGLTDFRRGDIEAWCSLFGSATRSAVDGAVRLFDALDELENEWLERAGRPRQGSSARRLIQQLPGVPILDVATAAEILGVSFPAANQAVARLASAGVLRPVREQARRSRRWVAADVVGLLDGFEWHMATPDEAIDHVTGRRPSPSPTFRSRERLRRPRTTGAEETPGSGEAEQEHPGARL
ncbi:MAG TPA: Fic family protein [Candidatus Dormibacteraeota bacterium]|jgi:Fic family protein